MEKSCGKCKVMKPFNEFHNNKNSNDGKASRCKECTKSYWNEYYKDNGQKYRDRTKKWRLDNPAAFLDQSIRQSYKDFSLKQYNEMFEKQNGVCAICKGKETRNRDGVVYRLHIDHDHESGTVRGLLCHHCNAGIGHFRDNVEFMLEAIQYLRDNPKT